MRDRLAKRFAVAAFTPVTGCMDRRVLSCCTIIGMERSRNRSGLDPSSPVAKETDVFESFRFLPRPFELASSARLISEQSSDLSSELTIQTLSTQIVDRSKFSAAVLRIS